MFVDSGDSVTVIQRYLEIISRTDPQIPQVSVTGTFDEATRNAVFAIQRQLGIEQNGAIGPVEWSRIITRGNEL